MASEGHSEEAGHLNKITPPIKKISIPAALLRKTRFEPSGIAWSAELNRYLIVSDDTGINDSATEHAPYLFLMDAAGSVDASPVILEGIESINDLEAIAPAGDGVYYLVSSQNISKRGKRPRNREYLLKVQQTDRNFSVQAKVNLLSLLLKTFSKPELRELGLETFEADGRPKLNIEGAAFQENALYLGLKAPISRKGAIIWKLDNPERHLRNWRAGIRTALGLRPGSTWSA